ncbi:hypothetical protein D3C73_646230 [compost metagenome]
MAERTISSAKSVSSLTHSTHRSRARRFIGKVVVVRTLAGTFTGTLVSVHTTFIRLRVFDPVIRRFIIIRIPFSIICSIRLFPTGPIRRRKRPC